MVVVKEGKKKRKRKRKKGATFFSVSTSKKIKNCRNNGVIEKEGKKKRKKEKKLQKF